MEPTIHQLRCFRAVATEGSFSAAAEQLHRSHPAVFAAVKNLADQLGISLLDRSGYRVVLTDAGRAFDSYLGRFLDEFELLRNHAAQLAMGREPQLRVVIGDLCPIPQTLAMLRRFFQRHPDTRLHLYFEAITGPWERLFDDEADLMIHHVDKTDPRLEFFDFCTVRLVPVVAPEFLRAPVKRSIGPSDMRRYVQCVIRDTARHSPPRDFYLVEGARTITVSDQLMKKEVIMQGMGWGHMPSFMIRNELRSGRLISIAGRHLAGGRAKLVVARRRDRAHGPIARSLWRFMQAEARNLRSATNAARPPRYRSSSRA
jgi:DNA-binding transcriptional LysR family regulator